MHRRAQQLCPGEIVAPRKYERRRSYCAGGPEDSHRASAVHDRHATAATIADTDTDTNPNPVANSDINSHFDSGHNPADDHDSPHATANVRSNTDPASDSKLRPVAALLRRGNQPIVPVT
ncbi:MAG TPA: hypothetical protein VFH00_09310 [Candidatus Nitrosotalea sp.]|nr:hypothetical protein [Candidatus Nitrosotalea sp.]